MAYHIEYCAGLGQFHFRQRARLFSRWVSSFGCLPACLFSCLPVGRSAFLNETFLPNWQPTLHSHWAASPLHKSEKSEHTESVSTIRLSSWAVHAQPKYKHKHKHHQRGCRCLQPRQVLMCRNVSRRVCAVTCFMRRARQVQPLVLVPQGKRRTNFVRWRLEWWKGWCDVVRIHNYFTSQLVSLLVAAILVYWLMS